MFTKTFILSALRHGVCRNFALLGKGIGLVSRPRCKGVSGFFTPAQKLTPLIFSNLENNFKKVEKRF